MAAAVVRSRELDKPRGSSSIERGSEPPKRHIQTAPLRTQYARAHGLAGWLKAKGCFTCLMETRQSVGAKCQAWTIIGLISGSAGNFDNLNDKQFIGYFYAALLEHQ